MGERWALVDPGVLVAGRRLELDAAEARHVTGVLRLTAGEAIVLADGRGAVAAAVIGEAGKRCVTVEISAVTHHPHLSGGVTVALGVLHSRAMDWAVQKAVETGAERLIPVLAGRSQLGAGAVRHRVGHWRRVARQAIKQCHRPWEMDVADPLDFDGLIAAVPPASGIVADRGGRLPWQVATGPGAVLLIGPEGGLTAEELSSLDRAGWRRVRLGEHVLRAETAVAAGTAMLSLGAAQER
ncbi:MAG: 16S rRNA (uracil(1498)-N(3))-methyltransferase [Acidobacteria bacterium]|nr:16S rRNA (uracil(1498)-N(3))-methyltransferase [Acidobacteriota bacterium]